MLLKPHLNGVKELSPESGLMGKKRESQDGGEKT